MPGVLRELAAGSVSDSHAVPHMYTRLSVDVGYMLLLGSAASDKTT
jgi:hypothetical protein